MAMTGTVKNERASILAINGGSSTIRFATFLAAEPLQRLVTGKLEHAGCGTALDWIAARVDFAAVRAIGHRVVHGMEHAAPALITSALLEELRGIIARAPEHLPQAIALMEQCQERWPDVPQVACFDTAFHSGMPRVARLLPIPRRFQGQGVRRYGFHGLSYEFLLEELARLAGPTAATGRVILAHLGNGASLAAVRGGKSLDTTMGFTPAGGLPMSTRAGDLDPGVAWYLMSHAAMTPDAFNQMINHESGLLGISETSSDMRDLLPAQATDVRAAEAVEFFCYQTRKAIGAFAAALGGLDTVVFSGGIGENAPEVRARICHGLAFLGLEIDSIHNDANKPVISNKSSRVTVRVIPADEEQMIARHTLRALRGVI